MRNTYLQMCDYGSRFRILKGGKISMVVSAFIAGATLLHAAPSGGVVTSGVASIAQSGVVTTVNQSSQKASINWQNFSIAGNETVNFNQPSTSAITLNRVVGNEKSIINGALNANGQVWILNSNGVLFNANAKVNTSGLLATTKALSDEDFQNGVYRFKGSSTASVINLGEITINNGGYASLLANTVSNEGTIKAIQGFVTLTGANEATINLNGNSLVGLKVDKGVLDALVENKGAIVADGGHVYLTTNAVNELLKGVVNNTGIIEAKSMDDLKSEVILFAHGGTANVSGTIDATGGFVETSGKEFTIDSNTKIKAAHWLIDPINITINDATAYNTALAGGADVTIQTASTGSEEGNIYLNDAIFWSTGKTLTLEAHKNIYINTPITASHANGKLALYYGQAAVESGNVADYYLASGIKINLQEGNNFETKLGNDGDVLMHTVVNTLANLQAIKDADLSGSFALGADIDASATSTWNTGEGFVQIGTSSGSFGGSFNGLGHTISDLTINRPSESSVGLFGEIGDGGGIRDVHLVDADIAGGDYIGGLVGYIQDGYVKYSSISGEITGNYRVGGLIGDQRTSILSYSSSSADVLGKEQIGGLVGYGSASTIQTSYATGTVMGICDPAGICMSIGGLVGKMSNNSMISRSYFGQQSEGGVYVRVQGRAQNIGGLVGGLIESSGVIKKTGC